jgi:hypothetical protein
MACYSDVLSIARCAPPERNHSGALDRNSHAREFSGLSVTLIANPVNSNFISTLRMSVFNMVAVSLRRV